MGELDGLLFYGVQDADGKSVIEFSATREQAETFIARDTTGPDGEWIPMTHGRLGSYPGAVL